LTGKIVFSAGKTGLMSAAAGLSRILLMSFNGLDKEYGMAGWLDYRKGLPVTNPHIKPEGKPYKGFRFGVLF
jgi:hypothetical protein